MTLFEAAKTVPAIDVAEHYAGVRPIRKGRRAWCSCPFHGDKTPSCSFDLDGKFAGRFICSSCHRNGSSVEFVSQWFTESPKDAAKRICADYGIEYDRAGADVREKAKRKAALDKLAEETKEDLAFASCVAHGVIKESRDKLNRLDKDDALYADDRGILEATIADAQAFKEAVQTQKDLQTAYALLYAEGVMEKLKSLYNHLKEVDNKTGTDYVSWYRRGVL